MLTLLCYLLINCGSHLSGPQVSPCGRVLGPTAPKQSIPTLSAGEGSSPGAGRQGQHAESPGIDSSVLPMKGQQVPPLCQGTKIPHAGLCSQVIDKKERSEQTPMGEDLLANEAFLSGLVGGLLECGLQQCSH